MKCPKGMASRLKGRLRHPDHVVCTSAAALQYPCLNSESQHLEHWLWMGGVSTVIYSIQVASLAVAFTVYARDGIQAPKLKAPKRVRSIRPL